MTTTTQYLVNVSHPTGFHSGQKVITVHYYEATAYQPEHRTCSGESFGYSRDYFVKDDKAAVAAFMSEHACIIQRIVKRRAARAR